VVLVAAQVLALAPRSGALDKGLALQRISFVRSPEIKKQYCQVESKPYSSSLTDSAPALLRRSVLGSYLPQLEYYRKACSTT
jgi:hypothetical protein